MYHLDFTANHRKTSIHLLLLNHGLVKEAAEVHRLFFICTETSSSSAGGDPRHFRAS